ncbi:uncharacterized protein (DUF779 family) [Azospirillum lipoferum]|uniref:DUF779 domain-containing protein n=2 Tax=Azospirillum lipoferum TaxID=193 RepID=A0A5A9GGR8_AZOLI|nr:MULTISPECIES: DUF779 domain-containing protein [Azospirillum]KAA0593055.1 DUF779 domain-containing protein [Azospirillum lipoferum]MCP1614063.1 uncharacterized protein (DUF779 family) [Azospirillum lipoferum]MDW5537547.1 DUF779 domain-containing protein [Azospirillum sp. NL1]
MPTDRVTATPEAVALLDRLSAKHGPLLLHLSGGCCDGSAPLCLPLGEFRLGGRDLCLGTVAGARFCMSDDTFQWWRNTQVILDVIQARGGGFSLEVPDGVRFTVRARLFTDEELAGLADPQPVEII